MLKTALREKLQNIISLAKGWDQNFFSLRTLAINTAEPYIRGVLTIVETPIFSKLVYDYLTDDEFAEFQVFLAENPEAGDVVPRSGGVRKIRWARRGMGKSGGVRVIYFNRLSDSEIWLLAIYAKAKQENAPAHILRAMKEVIENER